MAVDVATLGIAVDANGAIDGLRRVDTALDKTGESANKTTEQVKKVAQSADGYKALLQEIRKLAAAVDKLSDSIDSVTGGITKQEVETVKLAESARDAASAVAELSNTPFKGVTGTYEAQKEFAALYDRLKDGVISQAEFERAAEALDVRVRVLGNTAEKASGGLKELRAAQQEWVTEARKGLGVSDSVVASTKQQEQELRKLAEISRDLGDIEGKQFQSLIRLNGGQEKFLQIQRQIDEELRTADQVAKQYEQTTTRVTKAKDGATVAANRLRSGFATLASQVAGANPVVGQLASTIAGFAVGGVVTVGVLAGLSAIGLAYNKLTEDTRKAREEQDRFVESLAKARDEELRASTGGRQQSVEDAEKALRRRQQELKNLQLAGPAGTADIAGGANFGADQTRNLKAIEEATKAVRQAEIELSHAKVDQSKQYIAADNAIRQALEGGDAILKEIDERRKKEQDAELARLKAKLDLLLKINALPDLSALTANIDARIQANPIPDYLQGKSGGQVGVSKEQSERMLRDAQFNLDWDNARRKELTTTNEAVKSVSGLTRAAQTASQALEYYLVSKIGGGGLGASLGASVAKGALQDYAGGFAKTALGSAILGPVAAGLGAAVGGVIDKLDLFGTHAKEVAEAMKRLRIETEANALSARTAAQGFTTEEQAKRQAEIERDKRIAEADKLSEPFKGLEKIKALNDFLLAIDRITKQFAERQRYADEDLEVRKLRATGHDKEADRLALRNRQQQELYEAQAQGMSDEYIARLKEVQALELSKEALDELSKTALNLVSGYRYQSTIFKNAPINPFGPEIQGGWEGTPPVQPKSFPTGTTSTTSGDLTVNVLLPDGTVLATTVVKDLQKRSQRKFGTTQRWSEIQ